MLMLIKSLNPNMMAVIVARVAEYFLSNNSYRAHRAGGATSYRRIWAWRHIPPPSAQLEVPARHPRVKNLVLHAASLDFRLIQSFGESCYPVLG